MVKIIVNADDFGANASVNRAIVELMNSGQVNSTTVMANMGGFEEAIDLAYSNKLTHKMGVHLVLTEGHPLTPDVRALKYLFNRSEFPFRRLFRKCFFLTANEQRIIYKEFCAQIDKVKKKGISITHLDTHHQLHEIWSIMQVVIAVTKAYNIPGMRIANNLEKSRYFYKNLYRSSCVFFIKQQRLHFSDFFGNQNDFVAAVNCHSARLENKTVEIMVHPDFDEQGDIVDKIGQQHYNFNFQRLFCAAG